MDSRDASASKNKRLRLLLKLRQDYHWNYWTLTKQTHQSYNSTLPQRQQTQLMLFYFSAVASWIFHCQPTFSQIHPNILNQSQSHPTPTAQWFMLIYVLCQSNNTKHFHFSLCRTDIPVFFHLRDGEYQYYQLSYMLRKYHKFEDAIVIFMCT